MTKSKLNKPVYVYNMDNSILVYDSKGTKIPFDGKTWVSATKTRNYVANDGLLDWLNIYGEDNGFTRDIDLKNYDPNLDFTKFIFNQV